jgi:catechol 2,3-dioxygenase-like lactoylglutathione lyase family enzyme
VPTEKEGRLMSIQLNHTIVWCRNKRKAANFLAEILGLEPPGEFGPFLIVELSNGVSLDFHEKEGEIPYEHYAFLISEAEFDEIFARIVARKIPHWADPAKRRGNEINDNDGGRGVYFEHPEGYLLEVITKPYGSS